MDNPSIGALRWEVTLATRSQAPDPNGNLVETITQIADVHADIRPVGLQVFLDGEQLDTPISHRLFFRWQDYVALNSFNVIRRSTLLPDGTSRTETFRVRRAAEVAGRKRFVCAECELESFGNP